jgi:tol-pal system protein YbgF
MLRPARRHTFAASAFVFSGVRIDRGARPQRDPIGATIDRGLRSPRRAPGNDGSIGLLGRNSMTQARHCIALAAATAAFAFLATAPAQAAPSRAELEASVIQLENALAEARSSIRTLEERMLTGDPAADAIQQQITAIQSELVRVVGELEEARFQNSRLRNELRTMYRELQLRDAEVAEKLGLDPAFTTPPTDAAFEGRPALMPPTEGGGAQAFTNPFLQSPSEPPLGEPGSAADGGAPVETDPSFFGDDPFAAQRAASVGALGVREPLPDDPATALATAKSLLIDGRFDDAEAAFDEFQSRFGDSPQAGEALYWQGEARALRGEFEAAKNLYIDSLRSDPAGPRAPDAMIALASSLQNMSLNTEACTTLSSFPRQYPNAALSVRAKAERVRQAAGCR